MSLEAFSNSLLLAYLTAPSCACQMSIFHGCVPSFSLGPSSADDALPFEEILPWAHFSNRVPTDKLPRLGKKLQAIVADQKELRRMQARHSYHSPLPLSFSTRPPPAVSPTSPHL